MPKKPLTPYFRYFVSKRKRIAAKNPEMGATDLTRELSKKYGALSMKRKVRKKSKCPKLTLIIIIMYYNLCDTL